MQVTMRALRNWADEEGIPDLTLAELDYRLVHALHAIYTDRFWSDRLCIKGGIASMSKATTSQFALYMRISGNALAHSSNKLDKIRRPILTNGSNRHR